MKKKVSVRMCCACGVRKPQSELMRVALNKDRVPVYDPQKRLAGRGVYCCEREQCLTRLEKAKKKLIQAFRQEITDGFKRDREL